MPTRTRGCGVVLFGAGIGLSICLAAHSVAAGSTAGDAEAQALVKDAMEEDYLAMAFDKVEQKLRRAASVCQKRGCSPAREAEVHQDLAVVLSGARQDRNGALEELRKMVRLEPEREIDKAFANATMRDLLEIAREEVKKEKDAEKERASAELDKKLREPPPVGKIEHKPWAEQTAGTPVPVFVKLPPAAKGVEPERAEVARVVVEYQGPAGSGKAELKPLKDGWGGVVPCDGVKSVGELKYTITAYNKFDNPLAKSVSEARVPLKTAISGAFPHLPDELPPEACGGGGRRTGCYDDTDCGPGKRCVEGACKTKEKKKPVVVAPKKGGCAGCRTTPAGAPGSEIAASMLLAGVVVLRRLRSRARAAAGAPRPSA